MALKLEEAYNVVENTIVKKITHPFYKRTVELSSLYFKLITGDGIETLLRRFNLREDDTLFKQRINLTQSITPSCSATIMTPFNKVGRVNNIVKKIDFKEGNEFEAKKTKLISSLDKYYGEMSLDDYLSTRFTNLSFTDPNAFIITEFEGLEILPNNKVEGIAQPYPFEASSEMCINYKYDNNILEWLIVRVPIDMNYNNRIEKGYIYTIYLSEYAIKYTQFVPDKNIQIEIGSKIEVLNDLGEKVTIYRADSKRYFLIEEFNHKSIEVPAKCVGYKQDLVTGGITYVNPLHDALPYFMKTIKTVSEFDLTMALHAFPQKFQYAPRCQGSIQEPCDGGRIPTGENCALCKGTGYAIHTSAQDAVTIRLPKDKTDMFDLNMLSTYKYPPIDLLTFQDEFITQLENKIKSSVFNSETFNAAKITATATEMRISLDSVYDTIYPFAVKFSQMYMHIVRVSGYYQDIKELTVIHKFPRDFKFKGLNDLLGELKQANDSNAPGYVRKELSADIAAIQYEDKPQELQRLMIKQKFYPFTDKTDVEIIYIISNNKTTEDNEILWANFDSIFSELEYDAEQKGVYFYDYAYNKQKELLIAKINQMKDTINSQKAPTAIPFNQTQ